MECNLKMDEPLYYIADYLPADVSRYISNNPDCTNDIIMSAVVCNESSVLSAIEAVGFDYDALHGQSSTVDLFTLKRLFDETFPMSLVNPAKTIYARHRNGVISPIWGIWGKKIREYNDGTRYFHVSCFEMPCPNHFVPTFDADDRKGVV